jgi:polysaccharide deacetylase family protein (PEP-CTERM system associated)
MPRPAVFQDPTAPRCAFTVDVEDWYQSCVDFDAPISERVVRNSETVLRVLEESSVKATFFVQGMVAKAFPSIVREIAAAGHELQSHGYSHRPLTGMDRRALRDELERGKASVEDAGGVEVTSFRAADFSIGTQNLWALQVAADLGFRIDSSIFPLATPRYGIRGWEAGPHDLVFPGGEKLLEIPVAVWCSGRLRVPVGGGGYFRLMPGPLIERLLHSILASGRPPVVYCHPYEFNPHEFAGYGREVGRRTKLSQGLGRGAFAGRVGSLLAALPFGRLDTVLAAGGLV